MGSTRMLTSAEVAEQLGVSIRTMTYWRTTGRGPRYHRIGRTPRYRQDDVDQWVSEQAAASTAEEYARKEKAQR